MELDHLVYATPDLDATVAELERRLGVRAAVGGRHPGLGTRNRLIGLGGRSYLEVIGPDPEQEEPAGPRSFLIDWGAARHPTEDDLPRVEPVSLTVACPDPGAVRPALAAVGATAPLTKEPAPRLVAELTGRTGPVTLT
ncbi:VOC family protein [Nonomuraea bangladeshensis]|uniref:VOC family protein n=1 Tax=Nonomuraea bangladeshensis TaxID=404385 RepID=UPI0031E3849A